MELLKATINDGSIVSSNSLCLDVGWGIQG